jgi:hypothetical protein
MPAIETLDHCPDGDWWVLDVMRAKSRVWDWNALMIDVEPDDFRERRPGSDKARSCWLRIPGKHRNRDAACAALEDLIATRH